MKKLAKLFVSGNLSLWLLKNWEATRVHRPDGESVFVWCEMRAYQIFSGLAVLALLLAGPLMHALMPNAALGKTLLSTCNGLAILFCLFFLWATLVQRRRHEYALPLLEQDLNNLIRALGIFNGIGLDSLEMLSRFADEKLMTCCRRRTVAAIEGNGEEYNALAGEAFKAQAMGEIFFAFGLIPDMNMGRYIARARKEHLAASSGGSLPEGDHKA